jgi:hypothetical protein
MKPILRNIVIRNSKVANKIIENSLSDYSVTQTWKSFTFSNVECDVLISVAVVSVKIYDVRVDSDVKTNYGIKGYDAHISLKNLDFSCTCTSSLIHLIYSKSEVSLTQLNVHDASIRNILDNMNNNIVIEDMTISNVACNLGMNFY